MEWETNSALIITPPDYDDHDTFEYVMSWYEYNGKPITEVISFTWCELSIDWGKLNNLWMHIIPPCVNPTGEAIDWAPNVIIQFNGEGMLTDVEYMARKEKIPYHKVSEGWQPQVFKECNPDVFWNNGGLETLAAA